MNNPIGEFSGEEAITILDNQKDLHTKSIKDKLFELDSIDTFHKWHNIIHSLEEFINIPIFGIDDEVQLNIILSTPLDESFFANPNKIKEVKAIIKNNFDENVSDRFAKMMLMTAAINKGFKSLGFSSFGNGINLNTVENAIAYYQSRRRYFVTFLYIIPKLSKGKRQIEEIQLINEFLPIIELSCVGLTSNHYQRILLEIYNDFKLISDGVILNSNYDFQPLEKLFVEPERISIIDQVSFRANQTQKMNLFEMDKKKVFSIPELKNSIILIEATYALYEIEDSDFKIFKNVILNLIKYCRNDYYISVTIIEFDNFISFYSDATQRKIRKYLLNNSNDYGQNLNSFHPLIKADSKYVSNLNLLMRFLYYFKNVFLNKKKKFQIHSGFVFEDMIKNDLEKYGFHVTDIKRINRKEFDVVTIYHDVIYNFQCKNNSVDLTFIESDLKSYTRYNRYLVSYYEKALIKEQERESLLIDNLGIKKIKHYVISRFPIITNNEKIISFNNLERYIKNNVVTVSK